VALCIRDACVVVTAVRNHSKCGVARVGIVVAQTRMIEDVLPFQTQLKIPPPFFTHREALQNRNIRGPIAGIAEESQVRGYRSAEGEVLHSSAVGERTNVESGRIGGDQSRTGTAREERRWWNVDHPPLSLSDRATSH
jgi:hypothetical protein